MDVTHVDPQILYLFLKMILYFDEEVRIPNQNSVLQYPGILFLLLLTILFPRDFVEGFIHTQTHTQSLLCKWSW